MPTILENYISHGSYGSYLAMPEAYRGHVPYSAFRARNEEFWGRGMEASRRSKADRVSYLKGQGAFFDYIAWAKGRAEAIARHRASLEARRRAEGDAEIAAASQDAIGSRVGDEAWRPSDHKVLSALIGRCSESGMLYAGAEGLAALAGVSRRTAFAVRKRLEGLGVLVRVSTGGRRADGHTAANRYFIRYNLLRDLLGIENRWESRYKGEELEARDKKRFFSAYGFAHASRSERQIRRILARIREASPKAFESLLRRFGGKVSSLLKDLDDESRIALYPRLLKTEKNIKGQSESPVVVRKTAKDTATWQELIPYNLKAFLSSLPEPKRESIINSVGSFSACTSQEKLAAIASRYLANLESALNR